MSKQEKMIVDLEPLPIDLVIRRYQEELATAQRRLATAIKIRENILKRKEQS